MLGFLICVLCMCQSSEKDAHALVLRLGGTVEDRESAGLALESLGSSACEAVEQGMAHPDTEVARQCARLWAYLKWYRILDTGFRSAIDSDLRLLAYSTQPERERALRRIMRRGDRRAGPILAELIRVDTTSLGRSALRLLSVTDSLPGKPLPELRAHALSASYPYRPEAVMALTRVEGRTCVPTLLDLLENEDEEVALAAMRGLGRLRHSPFAARARTFLQHDRAAFRIAAAEVLGILGVPADADMLRGTPEFTLAVDTDMDPAAYERALIPLVAVARVAAPRSATLIENLVFDSGTPDDRRELALSTLLNVGATPSRRRDLVRLCAYPYLARKSAQWLARADPLQDEERDALCAVLLDVRDRLARWDILICLARNPRGNAEGPVIDALVESGIVAEPRSDCDERVVRYLDTHVTPKVAAAVRALATKAQHRSIRIAALEWLAAAQDRAPREQIRARLKDIADPVERSALIGYLLALRDPTALREATAFLDDEHRTSAGLLLLEQAFAGGCPELRRRAGMLLSDPSIHLSRRAAAALSKAGRASLEEAELLATHSDLELRRRAPAVAQNLPQQSRCNLLDQLASDSHPEVIAATLRAVRHPTSRRELGVLISLLACPVVLQAEDGRAVDEERDVAIAAEALLRSLLDPSCEAPSAGSPITEWEAWWDENEPYLWRSAGTAFQLNVRAKERKQAVDENAGEPLQKSPR